MYSVQVTNACGSGIDEILINESNCKVFFPSAFTPNNDGLNDVFRIITLDNLDHFYLSIYNRWGEKVFETNRSTEGWDGRTNGKLLSHDTYFWICTFSDSTTGKTIVTKGTVILLN